MNLIVLFTLLFLISVSLPTFDSSSLESVFLEPTGEHGASLRNTVQHEELKTSADNKGENEPNKIHYSLKISGGRGVGGGGRGIGTAGGTLNHQPTGHSKNGASMSPIPLAFVAISSFVSAYIMSGVCL